MALNGCLDLADSCQGSHLAYLITGRLQVVMDDGTKEEFGPGDVSMVPPGHNAWALCNKLVVLIEITRKA
jgi:uncharacterized cupin superfamily protein